MKLKVILDETYGDFEKAAMLLVAPTCYQKCVGCQNLYLTNVRTKTYSDEYIVNRFLKNQFTEAIIIGGLEPLDDIDDVYSFVLNLLAMTYSANRPTLVIYTGYTLTELPELEGWDEVETALKMYNKALVKFGRYIPNKPSVWSPELGVYLASNNQGVIDYRTKLKTT